MILQEVAARCVAKSCKQVQKNREGSTRKTGTKEEENVTRKQDLYNNSGTCGGEVGHVDEKGTEMWAEGDRGETERLQAMENGLSVIPHQVKGARGFAGRKSGNVRDVETVGNRRDTRWSTDCGSG